MLNGRSRLLVLVAVAVASVVGALPTLAAGTAASGYSASDFATGFATSDPQTGLGPVGVSFSPDGQLYVENHGKIYVFGAGGGPANEANSLPQPSPAFGLAFTPDGRLYGTSLSGGVVELDPHTGAVLRTIPVESPLGITYSAATGDLFVTCNGTCGIRRIHDPGSSSPTVTTYSPQSGDGITAGPDGTLYVAAGGVIRVEGPDAADPGAATPLAAVPGADGIAVGASVDPSSPPFLWVNGTDGAVSRVDLRQSPPTVTQIVTGGSRGDFAAVGPDGCFYGTQSATVQKVTKGDGTCDLVPPFRLTSHLVADPVVANISTAPSIYVPNLSATLTDAVTHTPVAGRTIRFTTGTQALCAAKTDASGIARCSGIATSLQALLAQGYHATFDGDRAGSPSYAGSSAAAPLVTLNGQKLL